VFALQGLEDFSAHESALRRQRRSNRERSELSIAADQAIERTGLEYIGIQGYPYNAGFLETWGTMASRDAEATLHLVLKALELSGQRGVLLPSA
jgi:hypothetical protein